MSKLINLTGQDFGYWHVIERAENRAGGRSYWKCKCTACGKEKEVAGNHLRGGRSTNCGCVRMEKMRQASIKDETGKTYGYLHVKRMATKEEQPRIDRTGVYWICDCTNCGRKDLIIFGDYLRNGDTKSCGCIGSWNESKIASMLETLTFSFKQQYYFENLTINDTGYYLYFDFAIFNNKKLLYLIEFDGSQHFDKNAAHWGITQEEFNRNRKKDLMKNKYCFDNNIPLIRIPYDTDYTLNDLKLETTRFLLTPENEEEYYLIRK